MHDADAAIDDDCDRPAADDCDRPTADHRDRPAADHRDRPAADHRDRPAADHRDRPETRSEECDGPAPDDAPRPPHVDGLPVLGNTLAAAREGLAFGDRVLERGDVVSYDAFGVRFVAVADPAAIESILVSRSDAFEKGEYERAFGDLIAPDGVVFTGGDQWRRQRLALQGSFTPAKVASFADAIVDRANALADDWGATDVVHVREDASRFALGVLARTLLNVDLDDERGAVVRRAAESIGEYGSPLATAVPDWVPYPPRRRFERTMADLDALVESLVEERRRDLDGDRDDLLAAMLDAADAEDGGLKSGELRDQLVTFLFAGHETTSTALTYVVWLLAGHPEVRARLDAELDAVLDGANPTFATVPELAYTEAVVEEALRLYPPAWAIYREAREATTVASHRIEPDDVLQLSTYHVHRDDRWWDDPIAFRPERWLDDDHEHAPAGRDASDRPEYAFFPFGGGPRHCIGMRFARMELQLAVATLASRLSFEQVGGFDPQPKVTLDPGDVRVRATSRR